MLTITGVKTDTYEEATTAADSSDEQFPIQKLPNVLWAGAVLFGINLVIGIGMLITPNMQTDVYGHETQEGNQVYAVSSKPSPFTEVVDTTTHKVRLAAKIRPVVSDPPPPIEGRAAGYEPASTSLDLPVRTQNAVYNSTVDVTPRRVSEREKTFVVIN